MKESDPKKYQKERFDRAAYKAIRQAGESPARAIPILAL